METLESEIDALRDDRDAMQLIGMMQMYLHLLRRTDALTVSDQYNLSRYKDYEAHL